MVTYTINSGTPNPVDLNLPNSGEYFLGLNDSTPNVYTIQNGQIANQTQNGITAATDLRMPNGTIIKAGTSALRGAFDGSNPVDPNFRGSSWSNSYYTPGYTSEQIKALSTYNLADIQAAISANKGMFPTTSGAAPTVETNGLPLTNPNKVDPITGAYQNQPAAPTSPAAGQTINGLPVVNPNQVNPQNGAFQAPTAPTVTAPTGTQAPPIDTNYQMKPGETADQYNARIQALNASKGDYANGRTDLTSFAAAPTPTTTSTGAATVNTYQMTPQEAAGGQAGLDAYTKRIADFNAAKPVTTPTGPVGQSGTMGAAANAAANNPIAAANDPYAGLDPIQKQVKMYTDAYNQLGLSTIKQQFDDYTTKLSDIQNELNDKKLANQNNPWLAQGIVNQKNTQLDTQYAAKLDTYTKLISLTDSLFKQGQAQVDHLVSNANADIKATNDLAQKSIDAATALAKDNVIQSIGGDQWLVNKTTGAKIANLGPVSPSTSATSLADKEALAAFQAGLKPDPTTKTQVVSIDGHQWLVNTQTGAKIQDLGPVTNTNSIDNLFGSTPTDSTSSTPLSLYDQASSGIDWSALGL